VTLESRIAIEALRAGVPNRAAVRLMGTEEPNLEQQFDEQLHHAWDTHRIPGLGIAGGFGSGKSHFLGYLAEVARAQNFVVSRVVVSKETPMSDPARVFEAAMRAATLPDRHDDAITGVLTILRQSRDKMAALDSAVEQASDSLAPIFSALLFLVRRDALPTGFGRQLERFLAGGKIRPGDVRQALSAVGEVRKYDLRLPTAGLLMEQRIQFVTALLHAAGYAGWCLLFDEVELIGRYTPLRRALAYTWLATWIGLDGARSWPGIVAGYAITDDFVTAVIDDRQDELRLTDRLRLKERHHEARLATTAMRHIAETVRTRRLRAPGVDELARANHRLSRIYQEAYGWEPPATNPPERTATRTMRQYIKGWITEWDMRRLTGDLTRTVVEEIAANYTEEESLSTPAEDDQG
jgi:hypothetical protein